ncbi:hypothetical protein FB451DRAFT_1292078 [Mycena latifolia]|nr:hypothetical protein FB451DRAFT_1292078 [Mycena latifolia]
MNSVPDANYDRRLLAQAPAATRAQLQQGYDSVLLAPNRRAKTQSDLAVNEVKEPEPAPRPWQPFWTQRRKLMFGLLIMLVVITAIVGGTVGATERKKEGPDTTDVGTGALSSGDASQSGIFVPPSSTSTGASLSQDSVAIATQPVASSDLFAQVTARHFVTARRRSQ